ncbi:MAG: 50S ribosomal protein L30 [Clostridia bacterium]|nr:50S ribosomal protein L30 [Clostridia bacterium]
MKTYKITLVKSLNGRVKKHIATAESLGLKRIGDTTVQPDNAMTLGKIQQISYLIRVEEMN